MRIDEDKLKNEIYKLSKEFYKTKSFTDYRLKASTIVVLSFDNNKLLYKNCIN